MSPLPALFIGHGSPMNTLETNRYTNAWAEVAQSMPKPRAIVAISAHWYINASAVTSMKTPRVIHDFYGFPEEMYRLRYPAMGNPELAQRGVAIEPAPIAGLLGDEVQRIEAAAEQRGLTGVPSGLRDLDEIFPGFSGTVRECLITKWHEGQTFNFPGRGKLQPIFTRDHGRLHLAGDYLGTMYTETAITTGTLAGRDVVAKLATGR